jgi:hypothetical protein
VNQITAIPAIRATAKATASNRFVFA